MHPTRPQAQKGAKKDAKGLHGSLPRGKESKHIHTRRACWPDSGNSLFFSHSAGDPFHPLSVLSVVTCFNYSTVRGVGYKIGD